MKRIVSLALVICALALLFACAAPYTPPAAAELLDLGEKYLPDTDYEQAIVQFLAVIEVEPMNPRGYTGAAEAYAANGQEIQAWRILRQGANLLPDDREIAAALDRLADPETAPAREPESAPVFEDELGKTINVLLLVLDENTDAIGHIIVSTQTPLAAT